ncbi:hypothetical protein F2Q68_00021048 [Brassica cretica]|uniref:Uncharacterized protein n=1 Tax=Brassica cretica TaxID=69181 RepID=A0A8S9FYX3_BRACR|nr:hypothetical protein F2Q68_00021048 [Brassica cretica]
MDKAGGDPGTGHGKLHSGEPGFLLAGILGTGFASYCSISSSNSRNNLCTQVNRSCSFSTGFPQAGHRSNRGLVQLGPLILVEDGELWASDCVLETMDPGALTFPEEELHARMCRG